MTVPRGARRHRDTRSTRPLGRDTRRALHHAAVYLLALVPIVLVYGTRERGLLTAVPIGVVGAAVTWLVSTDAAVARERRLLYAASVGLVLAEVAWALGYWAVLALVGGAAIWLALYALSGVAEHALAGTLDRRVAREYAVVGAVGAVIVLASQPWRA